MKFIQSTGGREQDGFVRETNDCAVVALSHAAGIGYKLAHEIFAAQGRRSRRGVKISQIESAFVACASRFSFKVVPTPSSFRESLRRISWGGFRRTYSRTGGATVAQFVSTLPKKGRFLLCSSHHAFAYIDGVIYDNRHKATARGRMAFCAEITPLGTPEPLPKAPRKYEYPMPKPELAQSDISQMWERLNKLEGKL